MQTFDGLSFLHGREIVHQDLKPSNILVSNAHYSNVSKEEARVQWQTGHVPIVTKLTDFGESLSDMIQTKSLVASKVEELNRGSPAYMAPEILIADKRPQNASLDDLKAVDIWAFGMVMFMLCNLPCEYPYYEEIQHERQQNKLMSAREILERTIRQEQQPSPVQKYEEQQAVHWDLLLQLQDLCASFDAERRILSVEGIIKIIHEDKAVARCEVVNLPVSQFSSIEKYNKALTVKLLSQAKDSNLSTAPELNTSELNPIPGGDGTNACTFLCLKICDELLEQPSVLERGPE